MTFLPEIWSDPASTTRDQFRAQVFRRDKGLCVGCAILRPNEAPAQATAAHHIVERRLFEDGGYIGDNGASLCDPCHVLAEQTLISCDAIRTQAGIQKIILPEHLEQDQTYDKWGNPILTNGSRMLGELFWESGVQKILKPVLHLFTTKVKHPRTYHLPWSPGVTGDDVVQNSDETFVGQEVVVSLKMDGENTTMYRDHIHARSVSSDAHQSRDWVKRLHGQIAHDIPEQFRICGENLYAQHSIFYQDLPSYFLVFGIWENMSLLSWTDTMEWVNLLGLIPVQVIFTGTYNRKAIEMAFKPFELQHEGYVIRRASSFSMSSYRKYVGKYVRAHHVTTSNHWMHGQIVPNKLTGASL